MRRQTGYEEWKQWTEGGAKYLRQTMKSDTDLPWIPVFERLFLFRNAAFLHFLIHFLPSFLPTSIPFSFPPSLHLSLSPLSLSLCMHICTIESIWRPEDNLGVCVLTFHSSVLLVYCCACQAHWPASFRFFCLCLLSLHRGTGITDACFSARLHLVLEMQI